MKHEILTITPEMAKVMLGRNANNRPLNKITVSRYASEMKDGRWKLNGEPIILNGTRLMDGQHRLHACVLSGVSFTSLVVEGVGDDVFDTIDQGDKRTASNVLHMAGIPNGNVIGSAVRWIVTLRACMGRAAITSYAAAKACSSTMVLEFVKNNPTISVSARTALNTYTTCRVYTPSFLTAFHFLACDIDQQAADDFMRGIGTGEGLPSGDPRLTLRNRMVERAMKIHKERNEWVAVLFIYAWNAHREGRMLKKLLYREGDRVPAMI